MKIPLLKQVQKLDVCAWRWAHTRAQKRWRLPQSKLNFISTQLFHLVSQQNFRWAHTWAIFFRIIFLVHTDWHIGRAVEVSGWKWNCESVTLVVLLLRFSIGGIERYTQTVDTECTWIVYVGNFHLSLSVWIANKIRISMANTHRLLVKRKPVYSEYSIAMALFLGFSFFVLVLACSLSWFIC